MNDIRKLIESLERIDEGFFSELDMELKDLYSRNPEVTPVQVVGHLRKVMGAEAAKYMSDQFERGTFDSSSYMQEEAGDIEFLQYPEGYEPPPPPKKNILDKYDWTMYLQNDVLSMMDSFIHKMKSQNIWDKGVELAGGEEQLLRSIQYEAEDVMDSYRGSGEGIGTSDINHFVRSIFADLGEPDVWGWDKPKNESVEDDDTDGSLVPDDVYAQIVADLKKVKPGYEPGAMGLPSDKDNEVSVMAWNPETSHEEEMVFNLDTRSFSGSTDDFMLDNPFESLEEEGELKSDDEMERDKTNRYAKYNKAIRGREGLGEENSDTALAPYEDEENWMGKSVRITGGKWRGETGKVTNIDRYRDEEGAWQMVYTVKLYSGGEPVKLYPSEWGFDQLELEFGESLEEKVVKVPRGLRGEDTSNQLGLSSEDAEKFVNSLGPDDVVSTEVVDPETGEVLDWPDRGTRRERNMKQYKRDEKEQRARDEEEHEQGFDSPYLYVPGIDKDPERAWEGIQTLKYDREFTDFYNIVWRSVREQSGAPGDFGSDVEDWGELDYDVDVDIPVAIKRADGKKFNKQDRQNFDQISKIFKAATGNIGVQYVGSSNEGTVARFIANFM